MMRAKLMLWGAAAAVALSSTAAVASVVVVRSLGPSAKAYPPGKTLPESASISLKGGDVVTLIGPSSAQTLRGPGNFAAKQVASAAMSGKRGRFGALRPAEVARNPSIWDLDITQSGTMCVADRNKLKLWRSDAETPIKVNIRSADGKSQELAWAAGKDSAFWPSSLPISNDSQYQIEWPSSGEKSTITFVTVPSSPGDLVGAAQLLIEKGCQNQLDVLVESASKAGKSN
jgi:hypothetical protein